MNIAYIGQKGLPGVQGGGIERHVFALATRLVQHGHTMIVYTRSWYAQRNPSIAPTLSIVELPSINTKHLDAITHTFLATLHALFVKKADIIHYHGVGPALLSWMPRLLSRRATVITTFHCIDRMHEKWGFIARFFLHLGEWMACIFAHKTIVVSETLDEYVRRLYRCAPIYIPNGAAPVEKPSIDALNNFGLTAGSYLLSVTRLIPHKGTGELTHAFKTLSKDARYGKKLVIVGEGHHTDAYANALKTAAGNDPDILFTGAQTGEALACLLAHAYAFVHLSRSEGMPIAVLEAMAAGLPTLLSDIPEHRELKSHPQYFVVKEQPNTILLSLARLLQESPTRLSEAGQKNYARVIAEYHWDIVARRTADVYALSRQSVKTTMSSLPSKSTS